MQPAKPQRSAETIALKALRFLAESPEALRHFIARSGVNATELRTRASDPEFLIAVLDFLMGDERLAKLFCEAEALSPRQLHTASRDLGDGTYD